MRFPRLDARDRSHRSVTLPDDLGSDPTVLVVSFTPQRTPAVDTWLSLAPQFAEQSVWWYDILVLPNFPDGVDAPLMDELHAADDSHPGGETVRSLVAQTNLGAFQRALVLDGVDRVYAFVVHEGRVRWRAFGPLTTSLERRLRAALADDLTAESVDSVVS